MNNSKQFLLVCILLIISFSSVAQVRYYASNRVNNAINTYQEDGTFIEEFITSGSGGLDSPQDIILHPDGFLLVTGFQNSQILKFDAQTGDFLDLWSDSDFSLTNPSKMSLGPDNTIYVTQWGQTATTSTVVRFDLDGNFLGNFTPPAPKSLGHLWDDNGDFYLALFGIAPGTGTIEKYDSNGNPLGTFIDSTILESPSYIWFDDNGDMLVQDFAEGKVLRYDNTGVYIEDYITGLLNPEGFAFLPNNELLIAQRGNNQITKFDVNGNLVGQWDNGGALEGPNFIKALDFSSLGNDESVFSLATIFPTIGSSFTIIENATTNSIKSARIFSISGKLIHTIDLKENKKWDATTVAEGLYIAVLKDASNRQKHIKLVVRKE